MKKFNEDSFREKFEHPSSSSAAQIYAVMNFSVIFASIALSCVSSVPAITKASEDERFKDSISLAEFVFQTVFALKFMLRFSVSSGKCKFMKNTLNTIDALAIFPYLILQTIEVEGSLDFTFLRMF